ncbi:hypothetical protein [Medusavirus stheno T3]|uniref:Uncharacterized protein n=1 Tax=Medusavirus stheno T3 TaxID=3069717 RepID=A0A7S7YEQ6_9VIRU|nr:hypothetical protein QKU73_gp349 [Acanthamoeba castellanii medusavirus]QPB44426.1 hypothetical protein [Medusavirus stheno T3]
MSTIKSLIQRMPHGPNVPDKSHLPPHYIHPDITIVLSDGRKCRYHSFALCALSDYFARGLEFASNVPFEPRFDDHESWAVVTALHFAYETPTKERPLNVTVEDFVRLSSFLGFIQMPMPEHVRVERVEAWRLSRNSIRLRFYDCSGGIARHFETELEDQGRVPRQFINELCEYVGVPPNIKTFSFGTAARVYTTSSGRNKTYAEQVGRIDGHEVLFDYKPIGESWHSIFQRVVCACFGVPL